MINTNKFQEVILKKFNSEKEFEIAMGWGKGRTQRLISGKAILRLSDVYQVAEILELKGLQFSEIFDPKGYKAKLISGIESMKSMQAFLEDELSKCEKVS